MILFLLVIYVLCVLTFLIIIFRALEPIFDELMLMNCRMARQVSEKLNEAYHLFDEVPTGLVLHHLRQVTLRYLYDTQVDGYLGGLRTEVGFQCLWAIDVFLRLLVAIYDARVGCSEPYGDQASGYLSRSGVRRWGSHLRRGSDPQNVQRCLLDVHECLTLTQRSAWELEQLLFSKVGYLLYDRDAALVRYFDAVKYQGLSVIEYWRNQVYSAAVALLTEDFTNLIPGLTDVTCSHSLLTCLRTYRYMMSRLTRGKADPLVGVAATVADVRMLARQLECLVHHEVNSGVLFRIVDQARRLTLNNCSFNV